MTAGVSECPIAKTKRNPGGDQPRRRRQPDDLTKLPDWRLMERTMWPMMGGLQGQGRQDTPLAQVREIRCRAFEEPDVNRRLQFAPQALGVCADCADANVLLPEPAPDRKQALGF